MLKKKKPKVWSLTKADDDFKEWIRQRDGHRCQHPLAGSKLDDQGCRGVLTCSHYIGRGNKSTRFDPLNCVTLCWWHHFKSKLVGFEYQKQTIEKHGWDGQYTLFMKYWLGIEDYLCLLSRGKEVLSQKKAIIKWMTFRGFKV